MSRIGKKPVSVPQGVKVELDGAHLKVSSSAAALSVDLRPEVKVEYDQKAAQIKVARRGETRLHRALHGTTRALIANMIHGVTQGFKKDLQIYGTGYNVKLQGNNFMVSVGFARPISLPLPEGIKVDIKTPATRGNDVPAEFSVVGADKCRVGQFAAAVRSLRPPEPYLGKGIRYANEHVKHKAGKAFASGT
ncbi:MAG: hypothetical protein AMJ79_03195 [Phycisphaerae bacterium SM23_30]|nr:MAG: hypothetical protein AMJ79_03195 [Phycisphaerae bacterium SM23_30]